MNWNLIADITSLTLILVGSLLIFSAAVGVVRFKDTMSRVHAVTKPQTTGLLLTLVGSFIRVVGSPEFEVSHRSDLGILVVLGIFAAMTTPVTAQRLSRIARREGLYAADENMSRNDRPAGKSMRRGNSR
ncbi:monovalent cation/H(+) antiporter subunit G [Corynebacterium incognita]|uniref:Monovalent cation/H(+) antiporter subunit G n=1 Tax=Corynebacterium incognita TaxID=2754725 RepID=A0A7G7CRH6_9CORY|nr:monovalent cation/H(+) antiporter subunit G [Corynebacterium incognita]QNE90192.1 monovalent cation/H(+) antiporter subunit G [Corynebacterium incognita]